MELDHRLSALLQLHLHSRLNTWLWWIAQWQLQDETRNISVFGFDATYIRSFTAVLSQWIKWYCIERWFYRDMWFLHVTWPSLYWRHSTCDGISLMRIYSGRQFSLMFKVGSPSVSVFIRYKLHSTTEWFCCIEYIFHWILMHWDREKMAAFF